MIIHADCVEAMQAMEPDSVDAIVCDPPYSLGFMSKPWDMQVDHQAWATEALRVLKPGGHLLAFGGTRTYHRLACAVEDAGFEIRDSLIWIYGSGFPKSLNLNGDHQGWGTALKPSHEPIVVARKPLVGTVAANVLEHGTGALNIDGCRIAADWETDPTRRGWQGHAVTEEHVVYGDGLSGVKNPSDAGRWPPNLTLSHLPECNATCAEGCPVAELDRQSGELKSGDLLAGHKQGGGEGYGYGDGTIQRNYGGDTGGASRFFYVAKASRAERNAGLEGFEEPDTLRQRHWGNDPGSTFSKGRNPKTGERTERDIPLAKNHHPTVKPIALMRWLVRLVTPPGGTCLDPFAGSGSTGVAAVLEGFDFVGIEREAEYVALAEARVAFWAQFPGADVDKVLISDARAREIEASGQLGLL